MGIRTITTDDLTGRDLPDGTEPVTVSFEGKDYEVYLSEQSKQDLVAFLSGNNPLRRAKTSNTSTTQSVNKHGATPAQVREWAKASGHKIGGKGLAEKGRVSQEWYDAHRDNK